MFRKQINNLDWNNIERVKIISVFAVQVFFEAMFHSL